jgi:hypothetical protein
MKKVAFIVIGAIIGVALGAAWIFVPYIIYACRSLGILSPMLGLAYYFVMIPLTLFAIVRCLGALFSARIRALVTKRPFIHSLVFAVGAGFILGVMINPFVMEWQHKMLAQ